MLLRIKNSYGGADKGGDVGVVWGNARLVVV